MSNTVHGVELRLVPNPIIRPTYNFDDCQQEAIAHRGSPLVIRGGAGTGKTTTLIEAAISRIEQGQSPESILILTFGRERASEIRDAIVVAANGTVLEPVARTFHALAFSILSMSAGETYRETVLISGAEQESFIADLLQGEIDSGKDLWPAELRQGPHTFGEPLTTQGFVRELRDLMMRATERGLTPEELAEKGQRLGEKFWPHAARFWRSYLKITASMDTGAGDSKAKIDPAEIINSAIAHLKSHPEILTELRSRFKTIMVDEFQETDPAQRKLLELLRCEDMVFVLDPKSAVGRFRGSDPDGSERYLIDTYAPRSVTLAIPHRGKPLRSAVLLRSESEEAQYIAGQIKRAHLLDGVAYSDIAIILRSHGGAATAIRRALTASGVPVESEREAITSNASITPFLLLAKIAAGIEPLNLENSQRLLLAEFGGASSISLRRIRIALLQARDDEEDMRSGSQMIIDALDLGDIPIEEAAELKRVHLLLEAARDSLKKSGASIHDLLGAIWENAVNADGEKISDAWLRNALRGGSRGAAADRDLDAMVQLFDSAARHIDRMPGAHPRLFLEEISKENIVSDLITAKGVRPQAVELLTVHSAKGREWKQVFVAGVQDGIWPNLKQRSTLLGAERLVERERFGEEQSDKPFNVITADNLAIDEKRLFDVAVSRAREHLTVTAFAREDSAPSTYFSDLQDNTDYTQISFEGERALTANALVASLRRALRGPDAQMAASLLASLKENSIEVADTDKWLGSRAISTDAPLYADHELVQLSPSSAESFEQCGLKWLLERNGGSAGDSSLALLGSVIHEYARLRVQDSEITDQELQKKLEESWPLITDSVGWISKAELKRASDMLKRFAQYHRESSMKIHGVELRFEYTLGRARVMGTVDRLQVTSDGKYYVVDFKTGEASGFKEAQANLQLACYQLAVVLDGFVEKLDNTLDGGSHLVYLGHDTTEIAIRPRDPLKVEEVTEQISAIVAKMALPTFTAKENEYCGTCPVRTSCPLRLEGRTVIS